MIINLQFVSIDMDTGSSNACHPTLHPFVLMIGCLVFSPKALFSLLCVKFPVPNSLGLFSSFT